MTHPLTVVMVDYFFPRRVPTVRVFKIEANVIFHQSSSLGCFADAAMVLVFLMQVCILFQASLTLLYIMDTELSKRRWSWVNLAELISYQPCFQLILALSSREV